MRITRLVSTLIILAVAVCAVQADVRTRQRTQLKFEGLMGRVLNMATGGAADGLTSTVAVKGARKADINDRTGSIVDLSEERVYELDVRRREYRVKTFAQLREELKKAQADAEKAAKDMPSQDREDLAQAGKQIEIAVDVTETGQTKSIAGHQAKQVQIVVTAFERGRTLEESGGMVMTNDVWTTPSVAALDEIAAFDMKFFTAVYGEDIVAAARQQLASLLAMYPSLQEVWKQMEEKMQALDGTVLATTTTIETVRSAAAMKQSAAPAGGGGIGGALARRMAGNRSSEPRSLLMTSLTETQSIDTSASDADVAIPAGFRERK